MTSDIMATRVGRTMVTKTSPWFLDRLKLPTGISANGRSGGVGDSKIDMRRWVTVEICWWEKAVKREFVVIYRYSLLPECRVGFGNNVHEKHFFPWNLSLVLMIGIIRDAARYTSLSNRAVEKIKGESLARRASLHIWAILIKKSKCTLWYLSSFPTTTDVVLVIFILR